MTLAEATSTARFGVRRLAAGFGAEITGLDIAAPLDAGTVAALREAFDHHLVLLYRRQRLPPEAHIAFTRHFGELEVHVLDEYHASAHPEIFVLTNVGADGKPHGAHPDRGTLFWHTDASFQRRPALATLLYAEEVPRDGGHTMFADMLGAWDALPASERQRLEHLRVVHDLNLSRLEAGYKPMSEAQRAKAPPVEHPLVRTHPPTGRKGIYIGHHAHTVVGMEPHESQGTLAWLTAHISQPALVYDHVWQPGDLVMWDNRAVLHRGTPYDTSLERRVVRRTVLKGDAPY